MIENHQTLYQAFSRSSKDRMDQTAVIVDDLRQKYTYGDLLRRIDRTAAGLYAYGIRENFRVGVMLNGTVEEAVFLLALNKIGAVSKWIDFTKNLAYIELTIQEMNPDLLIVDEQFLVWEPYINQKGTSVIVVTTGRHYNRKNYLSFNELLKMGESVDPGTAAYQKNKGTVIINSSGTTGAPKPIVHTDFSINAAANKMMASNLLNRESVLLKAIAPQIGLGLVTTLYSGLLNGNIILMISMAVRPEDLRYHFLYEIYHFPEIRRRYGIEENVKLTIFAAPLLFRALLEDEEAEDLSFVDLMFAGGSKMSAAELEDLYIKSRNKRCNVPIYIGYGQNELCGAVTVNQPGANEFGSAGQCVFGTEIFIRNRETGERCGVGETGEILEKSDSMFKEYDGMPDSTRKAFEILEDGYRTEVPPYESAGDNDTRWFNTHDLGYLSETGFLYITGRTTRVAVRSDFKVSLDEIEKKIRGLSFVDDAGVIITDYNGSFDEITAYLTLSEDTTDVPDQSLMNRIHESGRLSWIEIPTHIHVLPLMPYIGSGKIDYLRLKELSGT